MIVKKDRFHAGGFIAEQKIGNDFFVGAGESMAKAIEHCIDKIVWIYGKFAFIKKDNSKETWQEN